MTPGRVTVNKKGEVRIERGHPWVFRSDVVRENGVAPGAVVQVVGARDRPLGFAFYSSRSEIRLRMVAHGASLPDDFLRARLRAAILWRDTVASGADAYRLVHGEGDEIGRAHV